MDFRASETRSYFVITDKNLTKFYKGLVKINASPVISEDLNFKIFRERMHPDASR